MTEIILGICLGIGLAASTGFRVFVPLFAMSLAAYFGILPLGENWLWLGSMTALVILGVASVVESLSYLVPVVDNLLDTIAVPLAGVAGTIVMASSLPSWQVVVQRQPLRPHQQRHAPYQLPRPQALPILSSGWLRRVRQLGCQHCPSSRLWWQRLSR